MKGELQELRELVARLRADSARMQQLQAPVAGVSGEGEVLPSTPTAPPVVPQLSGASAPERLVFVPRVPEI
jgi:hypothetical protein